MPKNKHQMIETLLALKSLAKIFDYADLNKDQEELWNKMWNATTLTLDAISHES